MNWKEYKIAANTQKVAGLESADYIPTVDEIVYTYLATNREADIREISMHVCSVTGMTFKDVRNNIPNVLATMRKRGLVHNGVTAGFWCFGRIPDEAKNVGRSNISIVVVAPRVPNGHNYIAFSFGRSGRILIDARGNILSPSKYYVVGSYKGSRHSVMVVQNYMHRSKCTAYCQSNKCESETFTQEFDHCEEYYKELSRVAECLDSRASDAEWAACSARAVQLFSDGVITMAERDDIVFTVAREKRTAA